MTLVIGTDEAGYGPNLGPLVVAATAWEVDATAEHAESVLLDAVALAADAVRRTVTAGPLWGDSKEIYRAGVGMEPLERGVLTAVALAAEGRPASWSDFERTLGPLGPQNATTESPEWATRAATPLPLRADASAIDRIAADVGRSLRARGVRLAAIRCRCVYAGEFNRELDRGRNKSDILSRCTLELAASLAARVPDDPLIVWCDRHGGRKRYAGIVTEAFADALDGTVARPLEETAGRSRYGIGERGWIEFSVGGESRVPVAVASMTAKYVRERAMERFNAFWSSRVPGLRPTAGYPLDASRWSEDAAVAIDAAGIPFDRIWRRV